VTVGDGGAGRVGDGVADGGKDGAAGGRDGRGKDWLGSGAGGCTEDGMVEPGRPALGITAFWRGSRPAGTALAENDGEPATGPGTSTGCCSATEACGALQVMTGFTGACRCRTAGRKKKEITMAVAPAASAAIVPQNDTHGQKARDQGRGWIRNVGPVSA
jgi:hypothetical protein